MFSTHPHAYGCAIPIAQRSRLTPLAQTPARAWAAHRQWKGSKIAFFKRGLDTSLEGFNGTLAHPERASEARQTQRAREGRARTRRNNVFVNRASWGRKLAEGRGRGVGGDTVLLVQTDDGSVQTVLMRVSWRSPPDATLSPYQDCYPDQFW